MVRPGSLPNIWKAVCHTYLFSHSASSPWALRQTLDLSAHTISGPQMTLQINLRCQIVPWKLIFNIFYFLKSISRKWENVVLILSTFFFRRNTSDFQAVSIVSAMSQLLDPRWPGVHATAFYSRSRSGRERYINTIYLVIQLVKIPNIMNISNALWIASTVSYSRMIANSLSLFKKQNMALLEGPFFEKLYSSDV